MANALNKDAGHPTQSHSLIGVFVGCCKLGSLLGSKIILAANKVKKNGCGYRAGEGTSEPLSDILF